MAAGMLDETVYHRLTQGLQEEMMVAMLNTLQVAAHSCAEVCATKLRMMHEEMIQAVERAQANSMDGAPPDFRREVSFEGIMKELKDARPASPRNLDASPPVSELDGEEETDEDGARALEDMYDCLDAVARKPSSSPSTKAPSLAGPTRRMRRRPIQAAAKVEEKSKAMGDQSQQRSAMSRLGAAGFGLPSSQPAEAPQARREILPEKVKIAPVFQVASAALQATAGETSSSQKAKQDAVEEDSEAATESEDETVKEAMRSQEQQSTSIQELSEKTLENSLQATTCVGSSGSTDPKEDASLSGATVSIDAKPHEGEEATQSTCANLTGAASHGGNLVADRVFSEPSSESPAEGSMHNVEGASPTLSQPVDILREPASQSKVQEPWWALPSAQSLNMHRLQQPVGANTKPESTRVQEEDVAPKQPGHNELTSWWSQPSAQGLCMHPLQRHIVHGTHTELDSLGQLAAPAEVNEENTKASYAWWAVPSAHGLNMHPLPKLASTVQTQNSIFSSHVGSNLSQTSRQEELQVSDAGMPKIDSTRAEWWALPSAQGLNMMPLLKPFAPRTEPGVDCSQKSASSEEICLQASEDAIALVVSAHNEDARGSATTNHSDNSLRNGRAWWALPSSHGLNMHRLRKPIETSIRDNAASTAQRDSTHTAQNQISDLQAATDDGLNSGVFHKSGVLTAEHAVHAEDAMAFAQSDPRSSGLVVEKATVGELVREQAPFVPAFNAIETASGSLDLLPCEEPERNPFVPPPREGPRSSLSDSLPGDVPASSSCDLPPESGGVQNHADQTKEIDLGAASVSVEQAAAEKMVEQAADEKLVSPGDCLAISTSGAPSFGELPSEQTSPRAVAPVVAGTEVVAGMPAMEEAAVEEMAAAENPSSPSSRRSSGVGEPVLQTLSFFLREPAAEQTSPRASAVEREETNLAVEQATGEELVASQNPAAPSETVSFFLREPASERNSPRVSAIEREEADLVAMMPKVEQATGEELVTPQASAASSVLEVPGVGEPSAEQTFLGVLITEGTELGADCVAAEDPSAPSAPRTPEVRELTTEQTSLGVGPLATEETDPGVKTPAVEHAAFEELVAQGDSSAAITPGTSGDGELSTGQSSPGSTKEIELGTGMMLTAEKTADEEVTAEEYPSASNAHGPTGVGDPPVEPSSAAVCALAAEQEADVGDQVPAVEQAAIEVLVATEQASLREGTIASEVTDLGAGKLTIEHATAEEFASQGSPWVPSAPKPIGIGVAGAQTCPGVGDLIATEDTHPGAEILTAEKAAHEQLATTEHLSAATFNSSEPPRGLFDFSPQEELRQPELPKGLFDFPSEGEPRSSLLNLPPREEQTSSPFDLLSCDEPASNPRAPAPPSSNEQDPFQDLLL